MSEITLTPDQLNDSFSILADAVDGMFSKSEQESGLYKPPEDEVPRPNFTTFVYRLQEQADGIATPIPEQRKGRLVIKPTNTTLLAGFDGLRGIAAGSYGKTGKISGPAIILPGATHVALLTAEEQYGQVTDTPGITDVQHALLETEYIKHMAIVAPEHSEADVTNAGDVAPALVVASSGLNADAHQDLHGLADRSQSTFGTNFSQSSRQDFRVGNTTRYVRSAVIPIGKVIMLIGGHDQLPDKVQLFDIRQSSGELAVGLTLAASQSSTSLSPEAHVARLRKNFDNMIGQ